MVKPDFLQDAVRVSIAQLDLKLSDVSNFNVSPSIENAYTSVSSSCKNNLTSIVISKGRHKQILS